jgi:integrase
MPTRKVKDLDIESAGFRGLSVIELTLRHTHGYKIIQTGGHLGDVAEALGHASIKYSAGYAKRPAEGTQALLEHV